MQQDLRAEFERMREYKEQLVAVTTTNRSEAAGGTAIDDATVQVLRTGLNDLNGEMKEVRQQGKSLQDKLKDYLKVEAYREQKEEVEKEISDFKEMKTDFDGAKQVLQGLNEGG